jgi:phosphohistidine phosphatase
VVRRRAVREDRPMTRTPVRLVLMRHAKAADPEGVDDHERPLAERGERDAPAAGRWLAEQGWAPDWAVCSDAVRTRQTAQLVLAGLVDAGEHVPDAEPLADLYDTSVHQVLHLLASAPEGVGTLLVVGHEPTTSEVVGVLTGERPRMPTSAVALLELGGGWASVGEGAARLVGFHTPKD